MKAAERRVLLERLRHDGARIAAHFSLRYRDIRAEHPNVKNRYGVCYDDGLIKIRLTHAVTKRPLKYSSLVDTLCHELAHLRHFDHGPQFQRFFRQLLGWARRQGIYRPAPRRRRADRPAALPPPSLPAVARRNGVPVFSAPAATSAASGRAPWQRRARQLQLGAGDERPQLETATSASPRTGTTAPRRRRARGRGRRCRPDDRQLSLF